MSENVLTQYFNSEMLHDEGSILYAGSAQTNPLHQIGPFEFDYCILHYVVSGKGEFTVDEAKYELRAGDSFFIFPAVMSGYQADEKEPWQYRWVGFRGERMMHALAQIGIVPGNPVVRQPRNRRIESLLHKIGFTLTDGRPRGGLRAEAYLQLLFSEYATALPDTKPQTAATLGVKPIAAQIKQAIQWLEMHYYKPLSIDQMAKQLGYHRTHFSRMFKTYTGLSPMQYLLNVRMEQACVLLEKPLSVQQVSAAAGFADPLYFAKQFKRRFGVTPTDYRNGKRINALKK